jgi:GntR family transcriptional regulator
MASRSAPDNPCRRNGARLGEPGPVSRARRPTVGAMTAAGIDRSSLIPFYHQLKRLLLEQIDRDGSVPGDRLPSDHQLCERYQVSRTVVRQALTELEFEGVIVREKGRGTFLAQPKSSQGLVQSLTGLYEDAASRNMMLRSEVRRLATVPADASVAAEFGLPAGDPVVVLDRLRFIDDLPWVLVTTYLPAGLIPDLETEDLVNGSLYQVMDRYGVRPVSGRRSVEARTANAALARDLQIARGGAVLLLSSVGSDRTGRVVEVFHAFHRGDRTRFDVAISPLPDRSAGPTVVVI